MIWLALLLSCGEPADLDSAAAGPFHSGSPTIDSVEWGCDLSSMEWSFEVKTEQWTGAGWLRMAKSLEYAEVHRLPSVGAAGDGSTDRLKLGLDIAQDWRAASSGRSTAYRCRDESLLSFMITVYDTTGETVTDCRTWGADPALWTRMEGAHDCERLLEGTENTEDTGT
jgi:hypothetical protein